MLTQADLEMDGLHVRLRRITGEGWQVELHARTCEHPNSVRVLFGEDCPAAEVPYVASGAVARLLERVFRPVEEEEDRGPTGAEVRAFMEAARKQMDRLDEGDDWKGGGE